MGKATGIGSQFRGKVGNVIGYLSKNRAGRYEQTVKGYQPVVANPQTYAQALARVPVGPTQRICSALLPIVQRGFEGIAYGEASKSEFLSYNLKNFRGPFMVRGSVEVPPGPMLIARGSLQAVGITAFADASELYTVTTTMKCGIISTNYTIGHLSQELLSKNVYLNAGEQITVVLVHFLNGEYNYRFFSFILDTTSQLPFPEEYYIGGGSDGYFGISNTITSELGGICAAAVVRSQPFGATSFRRSTTYLELNPDYYLYNDEEAVQAAVASYRTGEDPEDWEDDPTPEYQQLAYLCMVDITSSMVLSPTTPPITGRQCLGYVTKGGQMGIFYVYSTTYNANVLIDGKAQILLGQGPSGQIPFSFNASYQPARQYSSIYGTM